MGECLRVTVARHVAEHRIRLRFSDGFAGEVDLFPALRGPVFEPLRDPAYFARFRRDGSTIVWPNGADFAPEYLHDLLRRFGTPEPARGSGTPSAARSDRASGRTRTKRGAPRADAGRARSGTGS